MANRTGPVVKLSYLRELVWQPSWELDTCPVWLRTLLPPWPFVLLPMTYTPQCHVNSWMKPWTARTLQCCLLPRFPPMSWSGAALCICLLLNCTAVESVNKVPCVLRAPMTTTPKINILATFNGQSDGNWGRTSLQAVQRVQSLEKHVMQFLHFSISPGSAETLVGRGGIINHRSIAYSLSNVSAKNYQNQLMYTMKL